MTSRSLRLRLPAHRADADIARLVLATLPRSLSTTESVPDLAFVGGSGDWVQEAHSVLQAGVRGIVVGLPAPVPSRAVRGLARSARSRGVAVVVEMPWSSHPGIRALDKRLAAGTPVAVQLLASGKLGGTSRGILLAQVHLAEGLIGPLHGLTCVMQRNGYASLAQTRRGGRPVSFSAAFDQSGPVRARVRWFGCRESWDVDVPHSRVALPARVIRHDPDGEFRDAPVFESGCRATWRRAHSALASGRLPDDLEALASALELLEAGAS